MSNVLGWAMFHVSLRARCSHSSLLYIIWDTVFTSSMCMKTLIEVKQSMIETTEGILLKMAFSSRHPSWVSSSLRYCFVKSIIDNKSTILYIPNQVDCRVAKYNKMFPSRSKYDTSKQRKLSTSNSIALLSDPVYPNGPFSSCAKLHRSPLGQDVFEFLVFG